MTNTQQPTMYEMVKQFHKAFNHPVADTPTFMQLDRAEKRYKWMLEEIDEFLEAKTVVDQADAMIDTIYFALGTLVELGVEPYNLFKIVNDANMSKLHDGKVVLNEDGKIVKPKNWSSPEPLLQKEIERQMENG